MTTNVFFLCLVFAFVLWADVLFAVDISRGPFDNFLLFLPAETPTSKIIDQQTEYFGELIAQTS